jgi:lipopolysaccharide/colanic/teichoic acid biosynthesis glycosyltransferase
MSIPPNKQAPGFLPAPGRPADDREPREPWPEIDRLTPDTVVDVAVGAGWYSAAKVLLDYTITLLVLPFALVLIGMAAVAVRATSSGPVFYTQTRVGLGGRRYRIWKIRTMYHNCEARSGIRWSLKGDHRITRVGRVLRATHVDELPQLFNVLMGQMSLVGPRPERPEVIQAKGLESLVPGYNHRLLVRPGVTGLAQVQLPPDSDITSVRHKVVYDLYYVQNQSLLLDLRLLAATLFKAAGVGPRLIRRLFLLPGRRRLAASFRGNMVHPDAVAIPRLQPA